ncbi:hypothetical protein BY458DRAFT_194115 [Sporodiniella umbellata]|nr:hypothetical protein BY458DRAFT_194115 [Sporodiniella umbellata]
MGQASSQGDPLLAYQTSFTEQDNEKTAEDVLIRFKGIDKRQKMLNLTQRGIYTLTPNISLLTRLKKLDLSNNRLKELPEAIGYLYQLEQLSVANNSLSQLPDSLCHLSQLKDFELSNNQLTSITPSIGHLSRLQSLYLNRNQLTQLPFVLEGLTSLILLDLSHNPISVLPAQIVQLPCLRRFRLEGCPLATSIDPPLEHDPPSLVEICARSLVASKIPRTLPESLKHYLTAYNLCNHCRRPYFDTFVQRTRWIEHNELWIPLEYRLCSAHWSHESQRLLVTFSESFIHHTQPFYQQDAFQWKHKMKTTLKNR